MKKQIEYSIGAMLAAIAILLQPSAANAQSQWKWAFNLAPKPVELTMKSPTALFVDEGRGRYYVVESKNNMLLSFEKTGEYLQPFTAEGKLLAPFDMVRDKQGFIWIVEKGRNTLTKISLKTKEVTPNTIEFKGKTVFPDRLEYAGNTLYLLDRASGTILALDNNLTVDRSFDCKDCVEGFVDFKVKDRKVIALNQEQRRIYTFTDDGEEESTIDLDQENLGFPRSFDRDTSGSYYILDRHRGTVSVFNRNGKFSYSFLTHGQAQDQMYYPIELRFDPWGRLCIVDQGNARVQVYSRQ